MKIAVVLLNWNGVRVLKEYLPSIVAHSKEADVYVIDNHSEDNSIDLITREFPSVTIIRNDGNYGFAKGYNQGLKHIDADILSLVNTDIRVTKDWLQPIIKTFEEQLNTAIIQPKILNDSRPEYFDYAGGGGGYLDELGYPYCRGRLLNRVEKDNGQYDDDRSIFWASGACFFVRKIVFDTLRGFDDDYYAYHEEIDLCWRTQHLGYNIQYVSQSKVYHLGSASFGAKSPIKIFFNFRNSLYNIYKHLPGGKMYLVVVCRLLLDGLAGLAFLFKMNFKGCFAIIKAHFSFYANIKKLYQQRKIIKNKTSDYYAIRSIFIQYIKSIFYKNIVESRG